MNPGILYTLGAFLIWGLFPLYFRLLERVPAIDIVVHRYGWALVTMAIVLALLRRWRWVAQVRAQPRQLWVFAACALLLAANSWGYVHAVQTHQVVQASLGYFINPLVNVLLGVLVLREKLTVPKWLAVALAAAGVAWLTWHVGELPWIALLLAFSFGLYGLLRKTASLGALEGLMLETLLLAPLAIAWIALGVARGTDALVLGDPWLALWVVLVGPITVLPLALFTAGARRLPLATVGLLQYTSPSIQLLLSVWVFHEPFDGARLVGFALIWAGLAIVSADALRQMLKAPRPEAGAATPGAPGAPTVASGP
jgi:chloramphenicol-sensitive protein RarD